MFPTLLPGFPPSFSLLTLMGSEEDEELQALCQLAHRIKQGSSTQEQRKVPGYSPRRPLGARCGQGRLPRSGAGAAGASSRDAVRPHRLVRAGGSQMPSGELKPPDVHKSKHRSAEVCTQTEPRLFQSRACSWVPEKGPNADSLSTLDAHCLSSAFRGCGIVSNYTMSYIHAGSIPRVD